VAITETTKEEDPLRIIKSHL